MDTCGQVKSYAVGRQKARMEVTSNKKIDSSFLRLTVLVSSTSREVQRGYLTKLPAKHRRHSSIPAVRLPIIQRGNPAACFPKSRSGHREEGDEPRSHAGPMGPRGLRIPLWGLRCQGE